MAAELATLSRARAGWIALALALHLAGCARPVVPATPPELGRVRVLSPFGTRESSGGLRPWVHTGVDYGGELGDPVLATADGVVVRRITTDTCGRGLIIEHTPWNRYTLYCHLRQAKVDVPQRVARGEVVGVLGDTGNARGHPHVHLELWEGLPQRAVGSTIPDGALDPHAAMAGCFDRTRAYPTRRFVLTYPVRCGPPR